MKHFHSTVLTTKLGEVMIEKFTYSSGRPGLLLTTEDGQMNMTVNDGDKYPSMYQLKMYDNVEAYNRMLINDFDIFVKNSEKVVGLNRVWLCNINPEWLHDETE